MPINVDGKQIWLDGEKKTKKAAKQEETSAAETLAENEEAEDNEESGQNAIL